MAKPRPKRLYAVVDAQKPRLGLMELYSDTDITLAKGEALWEVEVKAIREVHKRRVQKKRKA